MSLDLDLIYSQFNFKMNKSNRHKIYGFEKFRLDTVHLMLYQGDREISLAPKAVETLLALIARRGEILSKDELMETIWTDTIVEEGNLAQYLHVLRKTLGNQENGKPFIETFRRRGYRFNGEVSEILAETKRENTNPNIVPLPAPTNGGAVREATTGRVVALADWRGAAKADENPQPPILPAAEIKEFLENARNAELPVGKIESRQSGFAVGLTLLLFVSVGLGYWFFANRPPGATPIESIAVLPFENGSGDADLDYLSDGLSESVIDRLSELSQLKVIASSSSFKYRGENVDVQDAARKLGAQAIVTGKVARRGDDLSIRVELIDARDNKHLWGEQFDRKAADALTIQREIARTVSDKLHLKLSGAQEQAIVKQNTVDPQAYELLLKGLFYWRKHGVGNQKQTVEYYEQAIAVDPNYALAYAKLSVAYSLFAANGVVNPKGFRPKAEAAARKALELDAHLADAHLAMAILHQEAWDWAAAGAAFKRAVELNPNLADVRVRYSTYLGAVGRHDEAIIEAKRAEELDPLSLFAKLHVATAFLFARRFDEAIEESGKMLELDKNYVPAYHTLGFSYAAKGMYREAIANYQEAMRLSGTSPGVPIYLGAAYAKAGEREKALDILKQSETSKEYVSPNELAVLYVALGEREKAFASLEKAYAARDSQLQFLKVESNFDSLRDDPRFQDLLRRVGLPQ